MQRFKSHLIHFLVPSQTLHQLNLTYIQIIAPMGTSCNISDVMANVVEPAVSPCQQSPCEQLQKTTC